MQYVATCVINLLLLVVVFGAIGSILRRIGYSYWFAILAFIPPINLIFLFILAAKTWPVEYQLARLRLIAGESKDVDLDVETVISNAIRCEKRRQWDQALSLYEFAAQGTNDPKVRQYALESAEKLKS